MLELKRDSLKAAIEALKNEEIATVLSKFTEISAEKESEIMSLRNRVTDLEQGVSKQEIYTSKDCIVIENMSHLDMKLYLREQVCLLFERYLGFTTNAYNTKACHYLSRWRDERYPPAIFVKFLYSDEKNELYGRKSWLAGKKLPVNAKPKFLKERLPRCQKEIFKHANQEGLIASTYNCKVNVFTKNEDNQFRSVIVNSKRAVDDIKERAIQKPQLKLRHCSNNNDLKWLRTSPWEECMQQKAPPKDDKSAELSTEDND